MTDTGGPRPDSAARRAGIVTGLFGIVIALGIIAYEGWQELKSPERTTPLNELDPIGLAGELPDSRRKQAGGAAARATRLKEQLGGAGDSTDEPGAFGGDTVGRIARMIVEGALLGPEFEEASARLKVSDKPRVLAAYRRLERERTRERASWVAVASRLPEAAGFELLAEVVSQAPTAETAPAAAPTVDVDADPDDDPLLPEILAVEALAELAAHHPARKGEVQLAYTRALSRGVAPAVAERIRTEQQNLR